MCVHVCACVCVCVCVCVWVCGCVINQYTVGAIARLEFIKQQISSWPYTL